MGSQARRRGRGGQRGDDSKKAGLGREEQPSMRRVRVKICCIASREEARLAIAEGADALGLVGAMPSGPGPIQDDLIAEIAAAVPPPVATLLLTSETETDAIIAHARRCRTSALQLVDRLAPGVYARLREALPSIKLVQVVHVGGPEALEDAGAAASHVDAILLDTGQPRAAIRVLGGTGRVHDWRISRRIVEASPCPVILAGGLRPENVQQAIAEVRPFGVDVCTGVRSEWRLDPAKLRAFIDAVRTVSVHD
jgi:phosphoribosylanthranilate isomerase